ncbi:MAG: hypothetical protein PVF63_05865 [Gammaproteobacteria bacterium]|jgi:hypothetical protein
MSHRKQALWLPGLLVASCALLPLSLAAQTRVNFISCPIVRDTASVPCWLTRYQGELYYMGIQTDVSAPFQPPWLGHKVLVEASVADDRPRICGGIVLDPIRISVMPELDGSCNTILPAEDKYTIDFNPRPPGPSGGRLAFQAVDEEAEPEAPPTGPKTFYLYFDVDRGIAFRHPRQVTEIYEYAQAVDARRISVRASRGATLLSDGTLLTESPGIAKRRSDKIVELLTGLGIEAEIHSEYDMEPAPADGIDDWMSRSVAIHVEP